MMTPDSLAVLVAGFPNGGDWISDLATQFGVIAGVIVLSVAVVNKILMFFGEFIKEKYSVTGSVRKSGNDPLSYNDKLLYDVGRSLAELCETNKNNTSGMRQDLRDMLLELRDLNKNLGMHAAQSDKWIAMYGARAMESATGD